MTMEKINLSLFGESGGEGSVPSSEAVAPSVGEATQSEAPKEAAEGNIPTKEELESGIPTRASKHFIDYLCGSAEVRAENPAFDLSTAMSDPTFLGLFRQGVGFEEAYLKSNMAQRYPQIASRKAMETAAGKLFNSIKSNLRRPTENGTQQGSAAVTKRDVSQMTKEERKEIIRKVQSGEKISFN